MISIAIVAFVASLVVSHVRVILLKQFKLYLILIVIYLALLGLRYLLGKMLSLEEYGIVVAFAVRLLDYIWLVYIAPYIALLYSIFAGER